MRIIIKDASVCENCKRQTCAMGDVKERILFARFKTERYTCPIRYLQIGPTDDQIDARQIDIAAKGEDGRQCMHCGLCELKCSQQNLEIVSGGSDRFDPFIESDCTLNDSVANILATSFLEVLFDFAANTNLNKALAFDGLVCDKCGHCAFVEVDEGDDSLEACRRLLGDIVQHNFRNPQAKITAGLMVLKTIPKAGNRDVITLVEKMTKFPGTAKIDVYVTTFAILRALCLKCRESQFVLGDIFYNVSREDFSQYKDRMLKSGFTLPGE